jgi:hypothetical protein
LATIRGRTEISGCKFSLDEMIPKDHLLRRIDVFATAFLADLLEQLSAFPGGLSPRPQKNPAVFLKVIRC